MSQAAQGKPVFHKKKNFKKFNNFNNSKSEIPKNPVPTLTWEKNNFYEFKKKITYYSKEKFGMIGHMFEIDKYKYPPEVDISKYNPTNDPHGLILKDLEGQMADRRKEIKEIDKLKPNLYGLIEGRLSSESLNIVMADKTYEKAKEEQDPSQHLFRSMW